jgi:hypothetical protein
VLDENSKKIVDNVVKEDDILNQNIASTVMRSWELWEISLVLGSWLLKCEQILNESRKDEMRTRIWTLSTSCHRKSTLSNASKQTSKDIGIGGLI